MYKHIHIYIFIIFAIISCKTTVEKTEFDTVIVANVVNDKGQAVDGATIAVFDNLEKFRNSIATYSVDGAVKTTVTAGGKATIEKLDPDTKYWVASFYKDTVRFPGIRLGLDNLDINNELALTLRKGSVNSIQIKLVPGEGIVVFWATGGDKRRLPLGVTFNTQRYDSITTTFDAQPVPLQQGASTVVAKKGKGTYFIKSGECSWTGSINILPGEVTPFPALQPCETGYLGFYSDDTSKAEYPIRVTLNGNQALPNVNYIDLEAGLPIDSTTNGLAFTSKAATIYTYQARSNTGKCIWVGQIAISTNKYSIVKLPKCN